EDDVQHEIQQRDDADEPAPRDVEEQMIGRERLQQPQPLANDVERSVAIEQTVAALAADHRAEAQIAIADLRFGADARGQRTRIEGSSHFSRADRCNHPALSESPAETSGRLPIPT